MQWLSSALGMRRRRTTTAMMMVTKLLPCSHLANPTHLFPSFLKSGVSHLYLILTANETVPLWDHLMNTTYLFPSFLKRNVSRLYLILTANNAMPPQGLQSDDHLPSALYPQDQMTLNKTRPAGLAMIGKSR